MLRDALPAKLKLEVTLSFLSTGNSYRSLSHLFRIPESSISKCVPEVCREISRALKDTIKVRIISFLLLREISFYNVALYVKNVR